ncbi:PLP-dependent aminotransferase family protein [Mitsuokella sp. AF33-22]|uniref:MocR-like pyridoxine biosynthesis transcription factor PdxR n=1 Tax=Mitsuokella sp. AF33-22 TaxID=2292047 RepID=UPI000E506ED8|nr:PLP-dependent aminotransferase family protein [Mitsuokella sp. AF33-22]RHM53000.1 PLP-dependent aminotransferase family protein [Mitsuokella sp. AF33-22]RHM53152.1 PLP-dependent aminotransferase family protein [Mitsuokella sp. AF33-22]
MLTYSFEHLEGESLYEHLYRCIRGDILAGRLRAGEKLPSKRSLARQLGISVITVEGAYGQLVAEGYCQSVPKKGFFVVRVMGVPQESLRKAEPAAEREAPRPRYFADFTANSLPPADFPFKTWTRLLRQVIAGQPEALLERSPGMGILSLRATIAGHLRSFRGLDVTPGQIVIGAGTEYLYGLLVQLLGRGKCFGVENPGYDKIRKVYHRHGVDCVPVDMEEEGISLPDLQAKAVDVLHISPSHHFPTGCITPISRRYELLGWASAAPGRYIIEDDYDSEFRLTGRPIPTMMGIDVSGRVIYMNTFSKTLTPTIRISYMVLPERLVRDFEEKLGFYSCTVSNFEQYTLARFIQDGYFEKHINRMRNSYRKRREALLKAMKAGGLLTRADILERGSGLHFLLRFHTKKSDEQLEQDFAAHGIRMRPLHDYYAGKAPAADHIFVLNYSGMEASVLPEAIARITACLDA